MFGAIAVIVLYVLVIYRLSFISINAPDVFGSMFTVGVLAQIAIQALLNILVVTNSIPSTGVTLPFISYGGSAMLIQLFEIGVVLNISRQINYRRGTVM
jgi:cell division protein FtsW